MVEMVLTVRGVMAPRPRRRLLLNNNTMAIMIAGGPGGVWPRALSMIDDDG